MNTITRQTRLAELKSQVAKGEYIVDAGLLADQMLENLLLVRTVRTQLAAGSENERARRTRPRSRRRFGALPHRAAKLPPARVAA